jgi:predicted aldo/keto reductase-like oxidoreductase
VYKACADNNAGLVAMKPYQGGVLFKMDGTQFAEDW